MAVVNPVSPASTVPLRIWNFPAQAWYKRPDLGKLRIKWRGTATVVVVVHLGESSRRVVWDVEAHAAVASVAGSVVLRRRRGC